MLNSIIKIFLLAIIPVLIIVFNVLERTEIYSKIFRLSGVELALIDRFITNFEEPKQLTIRRDNFPEDFDSFWEFLQRNSGKKTKDWKPEIISRIAIENGSYVMLPERGKVVLVPKETPVIAIRIDESLKSKQDWVLLGTVDSIEKWIEKERAKVRLMFDLLISIISISLGVIMEFRMKCKPAS